MGIPETEITLLNAADLSVEPITVSAIADTGALHLILPEHIAIQLKLKELEKKEVTLANGTKQVVPYVGPLLMRFKNRQGFGGAIVMGDEPLLGAIPMEDMDLIVIPRTRSVDVNPANPNIAVSLAKGLRE